jgi:methyl-accepting chemotaxis protein
MNQRPVTKKTAFVSLRWKLLVGFTLVFSGVFSGAYYWFYNFATEKAISRLDEDLIDTAIGAANGINVNELMALYRQGKRNSQGFSDDPRYRHQLNWFQTVHNIEPRVYPYSFIIGHPKDNRRIGEPAKSDLEIIYLIDSLWLFNKDKALKFLESDTPASASRQAFEQNTTVLRSLYSDQWGSWISAYTPLRDKNGNVVAILGVDIEANYVHEVQDAIKGNVFTSFAVTYGVLFILVFIFSGIVTKPLNDLTVAAERIGEGDYDQNLSLINKNDFQDEISTLARVFEIMVCKVRKREESLKQQVTELKIEIDQAKRQKQVNDIVDTDFFQDLVSKAKKLRTQTTDEGGSDAVNGHELKSEVESEVESTIGFEIIQPDP